MNIAKDSFGSLSVSDDILEKLKISRDVVENRYHELSEYTQLTTISESYYFENVILRWKNELFSENSDKMRFIGDLILLNDGFIFLSYTKLMVSRAEFSPALLFGAIGGAVYGHQRQKEIEQDDKNIFKAFKKVHALKESLNHLSPATKFSITQDSIWFRSSDIDKIDFEQEKDFDKNITKVNVETSKKGIMRELEFYISSEDQKETGQFLDTWNNATKSLRLEREEGLNTVADSIRELIESPGTYIPNQISKNIETLCEDRERLEILMKILLSMRATTCSRIGRRIIEADLKIPLDKHFLFRKTVYNFATAVIGKHMTNTGCFTICTIFAIGFLYLFGWVYNPDNLSIFAPIGNLLLKLQPLMLIVVSALLLIVFTSWVYSLILNIKLNNTAKKFGIL